VFEHLKWKLVERPLLPIGNSYVDAFPFLVLFLLLFISGYALKSKSRNKFRPFAQLAAFIFFIFVVHRCFCAMRGWLFAVQEIGRNDLAVFDGLFVFVPLIAFTILFGRVFCAWICPLGSTQELFYRAPLLKRFVINFSMPARRVKFLYLLLILTLVLFLLFILRPGTYFFAENVAAFWGIAAVLAVLALLFKPAMDAGLKRIRYFSLGIIAVIVALGVFITDPWCAFFKNEVDYSSLLAFFAVFSAAAVVSMAWCRYLCPMGAFLGIAVKASRAKIKRDIAHKLSDEACRNICYVEALKKDSLDESACLYCGRCVDAGASKIEEG